MKKKLIFIVAGIMVVGVLTSISYKFIKAETSGSSPESGATSRVKTLYNHLKDDLGFGSDAAGAWGDWGAYWNRIWSSAEWVPTGNSAVTDVKSGKTFFNTSRVAQTGTYPNPTSCVTQQYYDSHASATKGNNCGLTWTVASPAATGDDTGGSGGNQDPRTGITWSQYLKNNAGTVEFAASGGSVWNWDGTQGFVITSANATAGATYTNNGHTFTVLATIVASNALSTTGDGAPATSGTLTKATGTGDATITFSSAVGANNIAVGSKTASQLCSERGNGWRLPTQKELMQAYIDGSYWNLSNPANAHWSVTESSTTLAYNGYLSSGIISANTKYTNSYNVRCVR